MAIALTPRPCGVDGCRTTVSIRATDDGQWLVRHGENPEAAHLFDPDSLFVDMCYAPWVRAVHKHEKPVPETLEGEG